MSRDVREEGDDDAKEVKNRAEDKGKESVLATLWPVVTDWVLKPFLTGLVAGIAFNVAGSLMNSFWVFLDRRNPASGGAVTAKTLRDLKEIEKKLADALLAIKVTPAVPTPSAVKVTPSSDTPVGVPAAPAVSEALKPLAIPSQKS